MPARARRRSAAGPLGLLCAALLALTSCSPGGAAGQDDPSPESPESSGPSPESAATSTGGDPSPGSTGPPAPLTGGPVGRYVALGDSYTSAPFVPTTEQETGCLRSDGNYPHLLAEAVDAETLVDVSCAGADATAMIGRQRTIAGSVDAQFDALDERADLVTLGLGGNDFDVFATLVQRCPAVADRDPGGSPCRSDQQGGGDDLLGAVPDVRDRIAAVLAGVQGRAPQARVLLIGYPQLVPRTGRCEELPLAAGDYAYVRQVTTRLNAALRGAARDAGVRYVDVGAASAGHDVCADEPWVNGRTTDQSAALAYHPLASGQRAVARLARSALAQ